MRRLLLMQALDPGAVGVRIRQARLEAGLTQEQFCQLVGVTLRTVGHWEHGDNIPYRHLAKIGEVLNRESGWLLHGDEPDSDGGGVAEILGAVAERLDRIEQQLGQLATPQDAPHDN